LVKATQYNQLSTVETLIQKDNNINIQDIDGRTALSEASRKEFTSIVKTLVKAGADVHISNKDGETAKVSREFIKEQLVSSISLAA
jgi:ankyrin repeat protein